MEHFSKNVPHHYETKTLKVNSRKKENPSFKKYME